MRNPTEAATRYPERLLTVTECANLLRCTPDHVYRLVRRGSLPGVRIGRRVVVSPSAIAEYVEANTVSMPVANGGGAR